MIKTGLLKWFSLVIVMVVVCLWSQIANADNSDYMQDELLIRFEHIGEGELNVVNSILNSLGGATVKKSFTSVPGLYLVELPEGQTVGNNLETYNNANGIIYAECNYKLYTTSTTPDDPCFAELWGMHNTGQTGGTSNADINAPEAWDTATSASSIVVAVIDTGVDYNHPDLAANMWTDSNGLYGYDFYNDDNDPIDDRYHGTHVAGTIGAVGDNNEGVAGVCWDVQIMAIKFLNSSGTGSTDDAISSIEYATQNGADVINASWGGPGFSQSLKEAIEAAGDEGIVFVAASGNSGDNTDMTPFYPAAYDLDNIISVMATDHNDARSIWNPLKSSNYGATSVDVAGPGTEILSTFPSYSTSAMSAKGYSTYYEKINGTSMAAPHAAGACALLLAQDSNLTPHQLRATLIDSADQLGALSDKCVSEGRLNLEQALDYNSPSYTGGDDIDPETYFWDNNESFWSFYLLDASNNGYWGTKKYINAQNNLIDGHCKTDAGTKIPHYHFESNLSTLQETGANHYWDWFYSQIGGSSARDANAANVKASLAYAMDGYSGNANYDYWLVPGTTANEIFTDDCTLWQGQPPSTCRVTDRIAYIDGSDIYQHATIVNSVSSLEPNQIEWKCQYSGVYIYDNGSASDHFATPGCANVSQPTGSSPSGTWDDDYWDSDDADVYYK